MGSYLHKLGEICFRYKWSTLAIWVLIIAVLGVGATTLSKPLEDRISIPGTRAQSAIDELGTLFPGNGQGSGRIVYHANSGTLSDHQATIKTSVQELSEVKGVSAVISPFANPNAISNDGKTGYAEVQLADEQVSKELSAKFTDEKEDLTSSSLQVELSSGLVSQTVEGILGAGEVLGVLLALLVLIITFGALIAAGMPIINALIAVAVSMAALFTFSHFAAVHSATPLLAVMLGLAVGIDYSLFIVSRYRTLLLQGYKYKDAAGRAIGTAGNAVVFAAATVVIALSALSVVGIPFMTAMGLAAAATIAVAALVALTVTPAFLGIFGKKVFGRKTAMAIEQAQAEGLKPTKEVSQSKIWDKWVNTVVKHPLLTAVPIIITLLIVSIPTFKIDLGLPGDQTAASDTTQRRAYDLLADAFGPGYNAPLTLLVKNLPVASESEKAAATQQLITQYSQQATSAQESAGSRATGAEMQAQLTQFASRIELNKIAVNIAKQGNVQSAIAATITQDEKAGIIQVVPKTAPNDVATTDLIDNIRNNPAQFTGTNDVGVEVTGATALEADVNQKLLVALPQYLVVVVGLSLILLLLAFRSILVPLKATFGFLLSVGVMFGSMVAIFQWGWFGLAEGAPLVSFIPIIIIGILFGLAMDYEFFLVSGMHESFQHSKDAKYAITHGFKQGAKVVAAAATIMVLVFAGFITNHNDVIKAVGFGLALGIFVDAFIVRMTLVPAIMSLLGKSAWWLPKWLDKILPKVSIEGEK